MEQNNTVLRQVRVAELVIPIPCGWSIRRQPRQHVPLVAVMPGDSTVFRPSVVVTLDDLEGRFVGIHDWQEQVEHDAVRALDQYLLIDQEYFDHDGHRMYRRLAHYAGPGMLALTMEQWATVRGSRGYTVTTTTESLDAPRTADVFTAIANGLRIHPGVGQG